MGFSHLMCNASLILICNFDAAESKIVKHDSVAQESLHALDNIIKFTYNGRSDWLKQRTLSEIRERGDDIKLAFKFLLRNLDNDKHPLCDSDKININKLFVSSKYGS